MAKRKLYAIIDTETANTILMDDGKLFMQDVQVYDIAMAIIDKKGRVYDTLRLIIDEVFHTPALMRSAYYANKIPEYIAQIRDNTAVVVSIKEARWIVRNFLKKWDVNIVMAHNARFDERALNATLRYQTKSEYRYFMPYGIEWWDTQKMAHDTLCKQKTYVAFCEQYGYMTKHRKPRPSETAENLYRYLTFDITFVEQHRGFDDIMIEKEIFAACIKQHKKMRRKLWEN